MLLSGEPGIGKSRLTAALLEHIGSEPHTRLRYFCSPHHTDSALYPIIGQMERAARLAYDDSLQTKLDKLERVLAQTSTSKDDAALFAEMLSLPNDGRYPALEPDARAAQTKDAGNALGTSGGPVALKSGADDLRGCPLDRSDEFGSTRSGGGPDRNPSRAADCDLPAGIRCRPGSDGRM